VDEEIIAMRGGRPDFGLLQSRMQVRHLVCDGPGPAVPIRRAAGRLSRREDDLGDLQI
jgi:hypothetical protein